MLINKLYKCLKHSKDKKKDERKERDKAKDSWS